MRTSANPQAHAAEKPPHRAPLSALVRASATLLAIPELGVLLPKILEIARDILAADAYAVWTREEDGSRWRILHSVGLSPDYANTLIGGLSGSEYLTEPLLAEDVQVTSRVEVRRALYAREGIRSILAMPLISDERPIGTMTFYFKQPKKFTEEIVDVAKALSNISAAAINTAELYEEQIRLRRHAETERIRATFLSEATVMLASSLDYQTTLNRVSQMAVPTIADWCSVFVINRKGKLDRTALAHPDPKKLKLGLRLQRLYPPSLESGSLIYLVMQSGEAQLVPEVTDEMVRKAARDAQHLEMIQELGMRSVLVVPIKSREGVLGVITLVMAESERRLERSDMRLAEDLAIRAAVAIENAQLYQQLELQLATTQKAQAALQESDARLRSAQLAAKLGAYEHDVISGRIVWAPELPSLQGVPWKTLDEWRSRIPAEDRERLDQAGAIAAKGEEMEIEYRIVKPDGTVVWMLSRGTRVLDEQGRHIKSVGIAIDITAQKRSEEALRRTEKLAAAGRLAATIAHEINNPLTAITNLLFLAKYQSNQPEIQKLLDLADHEMQRVSHITKQTLGFYRDNSTPRLLNLTALVKSVVRLYATKIGSKDLVVQTQLRAESPVIAIEGEITQVLSNILSNAIDASKPGAAITIATRDSGEGGVLIKIADQGTGISLQDRAHLFEAFFTTKRDVGTGLGLWVSKGIIEKHGGWIRVRTSSGQSRHGTIFTVYIPRATMPGTLKLKS